MTIPGVPVSPGFPPLEHPAQDAIHAARSRLDTLTRGKFPFPVKELTGEEKEEALKEAAQSSCQLCGGIHPSPNTPACPRIATFECNPDGKIVRGTFWPSGVTESVVKTDAEGNVLSVVHTTRSDWDTSRVVFIEDVADKESEGPQG